MLRQLVFISTLVLAGSAAAQAPATPSPQKNPQVVLETSQGKVVITLFADKAPLSVKNFLEYVDAGFYSGTVFHRVIPGFMVQGGGFSKGDGYPRDLKEKSTRAPIKNEASNRLSNKRGTLAMARTGVVDSATAQFFINLVDNSRLDHRGTDPRDFGYAVFGEVSEGMNVVDAIAKLPRHCPSDAYAPCTAGLPPGLQDVPQTAVVITKASRKP